ncbi:ADP-ribosylglycohydrolase family protein [Hespellia stercorisuis]|uniref:ADP-ribosylglycohydrolase n=1 Tax=Hespellia stercorisuis DSM 15480 TaxID=1121950 RepID=A0A1M6QYF0_9FIRM|nr:ADP-ribosylglycohydrolase family protein [Hespellia stercorisuis]SHK25289.1 ADP-ribosylglycohydrolase [Hespellia stercorisuis DSM 15480]
MRKKILGVLYGMAIGDAMGMPPELWSRRRVLEKYGTITDFLEGDPENEISYQYHRGNFTDDTAQAITILDSLIETDFRPDGANIARHILEWAKRENAFENNILGPTSKITLDLFEKGEDASVYSDQALSNGAAMRIAPIGTLFCAEQKKALCDYVKQVSSVTHSSDITIAGAAMIAMAVASVMEKEDRDAMIQDVLEIEEYALSLGASTVSASLGTRIRYGVELAHRHAEDETAFLQELYDMMGAGVNTVDSVPCAIAIAYYSFDVKKCALMCANLGGDTDTIGAMATAICGGIKGIDGIAEADLRLIQTANEVDFTEYAEKIEEKRGKLQ